MVSLTKKKPLRGWKATAAVSMSNYIDSGSIIAIATSLGFWQAAYFPGDDGTIAGWLAAVSSNAFGAAVGALIGGPLCDKYGRKVIYTWDLLIYALGGLIITFASNLGMLFAGFIIIGLAVGASVPAGWTYVAEFAPTGQRGRHIGATQLAWSVGPFIGFGLAAALAPLGLLGSRIIFAHLVVIALITWYIRQGLEESAAWQKSKGGEEAKSPSVFRSMRLLFSHRANVTALLFLAVIYTCWNQAASQNGIFLPTILNSMGYNTIQADLFSMLSWGVVVISTGIFMLLVDRIPYRIHYFIGGILAIIAWIGLVFGPSDQGWVAFFYAIVWGLSAGPSAQAFYAVWSPELFATPYRAGAQGIVFFLVRLASGLISLIFPVILLKPNGLMINGLILIGFLLVSLLVGTIGAPKTQGKPLRQIEIERYGHVVSEELLQHEETELPASAGAKEGSASGQEK
ncbi:MFS transporter [Actinobaculum suis]|uniref:MFS transporter n=1 Tax=Actinobaculum suis TaxID=1657 RepID=A0AAW9HMF0_9ACTO|nr:MFS transporter [Actinobaculum suis]MDY5152878.1 MFS transporter [Actinobaculum suis]